MILSTLIALAFLLGLAFGPTFLLSPAWIRYTIVGTFMVAAVAAVYVEWRLAKYDVGEQEANGYPEGE